MAISTWISVSPHVFLYLGFDLREFLWEVLNRNERKTHLAVIEDGDEDEDKREK